MNEAHNDNMQQNFKHKRFSACCIATIIWRTVISNHWLLRLYHECGISFWDIVVRLLSSLIWHLHAVLVYWHLTRELWNRLSLIDYVQLPKVIF